jgi:hypothetical protein
VALLTRTDLPPTQRGLEHDPEKDLPRCGSRRVETGFPSRQTRNAFTRDIVLELESERVAQAVEHVTFNHGVVGSSPTALTK